MQTAVLAVRRVLCYVVCPPPKVAFANSCVPVIGIPGKKKMRTKRAQERQYIPRFVVFSADICGELDHPQRLSSLPCAKAFVLCDQIRHIRDHCVLQASLTGIYFATFCSSTRVRHYVQQALTRVHITEGVTPDAYCGLLANCRNGVRRVSTLVCCYFSSL